MCSTVGSTSDSGARGPGNDTQSGHILLFILPLVEEVQLSLVSYWRKYVHEVLVNNLGGLSLPRISMVRFTDSPDMTLAIYHGCKTTKQQLTKLETFGHTSVRKQ